MNLDKAMKPTGTPQASLALLEFFEGIDFSLSDKDKEEIKKFSEWSEESLKSSFKLKP